MDSLLCIHRNIAMTEHHAGYECWSVMCVVLCMADQHHLNTELCIKHGSYCRYLFSIMKDCGAGAIYKVSLPHLWTCAVAV